MKLLFLDRDGTLIEEPADFQIDSVEKFRLLPGVIPALLRLRDAGYRFVMVTNQDDLGAPHYPRAAYDQIQHLLLGILESQGLAFADILMCPHARAANCDCRKPRLGMVTRYLADPDWDRARSYVIGDRVTDLELATAIGLAGIRVGADHAWPAIVEEILGAPRRAQVTRTTKETSVTITVSLDGEGAKISTGIGFFDHMLEQIAKHGGFALDVAVTGDLGVDDHHTIEDTGLALGAALRKALGDKLGIERYGFVLPMDDAQAHVALDLGGRAFFVFEGAIERPMIGGLATEMVPHFFRSLADGLAANLHIKVTGLNSHHVVESMFKGVGRALRQAVRSGGGGLPSTKGTL